MLEPRCPGNGPVNGVGDTGNQLTATNMGMSGVGTGMLGAIEVMSFSIEPTDHSVEQPSQKYFDQRQQDFADPANRHLDRQHVERQVDQN